MYLVSMQNLLTGSPENSVKDRDGLLRSSDCHRGMELEDLLKKITFTRQVLDIFKLYLSTISMILTSCVSFSNIQYSAS
jgi:hypothetical protein